MTRMKQTRQNKKNFEERSVQISGMLGVIDYLLEEKQQISTLNTFLLQMVRKNMLDELSEFSSDNDDHER